MYVPLWFAARAGLLDRAFFSRQFDLMFLCLGGMLMSVPEHLVGMSRIVAYADGHRPPLFTGALNKGNESLSVYAYKRKHPRLGERRANL